MQFGSVGDKVEATFNPECLLNLLVLIFHFETHSYLLQFAKNWITECKIKFKPVFVTEYKRSIWSLTLTFAMNQPNTIQIFFSKHLFL